MRNLAIGFVLLGLALLTPPSASANSVGAQSKSSYGSGPTAGLSLDGTDTETVDGYTVNIECSESDGCPSDGGSYIVEVVTPDLPSGTVINITGLGEVVGVYCADSFFGDCSTSTGGMPGTPAQQTCINDLSENFNSGTGTDSIQDGTSTPCSLVTGGNNSVALIFDLDSFSSSSPFPAITISTMPPAAAPEPGSLALLGTGLFGLWLKRRSRA